MKRLILFVPVFSLVASCSSSPSSVSGPQHIEYISQPVFNGQPSAAGSGTYRTVVGGRSVIEVGVGPLTHGGVNIQFVSRDNWLQHHSNVRISNPSCSVDQDRQAIICLVPSGSWSTGMRVEGIAKDAGAFRYAVRFSDRPEGPPQWMATADGTPIERTWDENVFAP
jgi:hypothetical protein